MEKLIKLNNSNVDSINELLLAGWTVKFMNGSYVVLEKKSKTLTEKS